MFVTRTVWPRIPQRTLHGRRFMQETISASFLRGDNTRGRRLPYLPLTKRWSNISKDFRWLCVRQPMGGAPQPLPYQDV